MTEPTPHFPPKGTFANSAQVGQPVPLEPFSAAQRRVYLEEFRRTVLPLRSAEAAGVSLATVKAHEMSDPTFAAAVGEAKRWHLEAIESTIQRRAGVGEDSMESIDGVRYSDDLLKLYAKARMPKRYGDKVAVRAQVDVEGDVHHAVDVDVGALSVAGRAHLRALLQDGGMPSNTPSNGEPATLLPPGTTVTCTSSNGHATGKNGVG